MINSKLHYTFLTDSFRGRRDTAQKCLDHAIDTLFKLSTVYPDGKSLQKWVQYQNMDSMEQFFQWDERQLAVGELSTSYLEVPQDKTALEYLKTNPIKNLLMLCKYIHHLVMEAQPAS